MDLTPEELKELVKTATSQAVKETMENQKIVCSCGLSLTEQRALPHVLGVFCHMGGGGPEDYDKGAEVFRKNNDFVAQWRAACEKTGGTILRDARSTHHDQRQL